MAWNGVVSQARESTHRMKVETIVSPCPGTTELLILLENYRVDSSTPERARGGQPRCSRTNDDDRGLWQRNSSVENQFCAGDDKHERKQLSQYGHGRAFAPVTRADPATDQGGSAPHRNIGWELRHARNVSQQSGN